MLDLVAQKQAIRDAAERFSAFHPRGPATGDQRAQAEEIVAGQVRFNGAHPEAALRPRFEVGRKGIDWSGGHFHHQEWPTQLGRFFMLGPLMARYRETRDTRYAAAARDYIADYIASFDFDNIELRGNTCMDIGIRLGTHGFGGWGEALGVFLDDPAWDDGFIGAMLASVERQARILWKRGIPSRSWGNHRIFGLDGLLHVTLRVPFLADAEAMRASALRGLRHAMRQQFLPDGAHLELTLGYHQHMAETFLYLHQLGTAFPEADAGLPVERLLGAADYLLHTLPAGLNDTGAAAEDRAHEAAWRAARHWRAQLTGRDESTWQPPADNVFPNAGQAFLRSGWEPGADFLAFDAAPYSGAHAHLARLGLVFRTGGRLRIADPGTFDYEMSNPYAVYGRSTRAHSTLNLNGLNQGLGDAKLLRSVVRPDLAFLHGLYPGGYWSGTYTWGFQKGVGQGTHGRHERIVVWIRGEYLLVFDMLACDPGSATESVWQLAPVKKWEQRPEELAWRSGGDDPFLLRMVLPPEGVAMAVHEGEKDPIRGWFCESSGTGFKPAPQVVFTYPSQPAFFAVLAMPLGGGRQEPVVRRIPMGSGRGLELAWPDGSRDLVGLSASICVPLDEASPFQTDSPLVWLRLDATGKPVRHFMMEGTELAFEGTIIS